MLWYICYFHLYYHVITIHTACPLTGKLCFIHVIKKIPKKGTAMALAVAFNTMLSHQIKNISVQFRLTFLCGFSLHVTQFNRSNLT